MPPRFCDFMICKSSFPRYQLGTTSGPQISPVSQPANMVFPTWMKLPEQQDWAVSRLEKFFSVRLRSQTMMLVINEAVQVRAAANGKKRDRVVGKHIDELHAQWQQMWPEEQTLWPGRAFWSEEHTTEEARMRFHDEKVVLAAAKAARRKVRLNVCNIDEFS